MRIKIVILAIVYVAILSGCSSDKTDKNLEQKSESTGIPLLDIKNKAEKNIDKAVDEKNSNLNKALEETGVGN